MDQDKLKSWLELAASGDKEAREKLIKIYRPFILREGGRVCRRVLSWGHDDETSIALIAFNEAIDAYRCTKGSSFNQFCRMVIRRRLYDHFRREGKATDIPDSEGVIAHSVFEEDWDRVEREEEVEKYRDLLNKFNLSFEIIAKVQPKHRLTRQKLRQTAILLAEDDEMMSYLLDKGKLPKQRLCEMAGVTSRTMDRGRTYVIALALLLSRDDLPHLQGYAREMAGEGEY